jgi:hypothetical protein
MALQLEAIRCANQQQRQAQVPQLSAQAVAT